IAQSSHVATARHLSARGERALQGWGHVALALPATAGGAGRLSSADSLGRLLGLFFFFLFFIWRRRRRVVKNLRCGSRLSEGCGVRDHFWFTRARIHLPENKS